VKYRRRVSSVRPKVITAANIHSVWFCMAQRLPQGG
jgi:hypothetical protein